MKGYFVVTDLILYTKRIKDHGLPVEAEFPPKLLELETEDILFVDRVIVTMRAQIVTKQILVQGTIDALIQSDCARCLSVVSQKLHLPEVVILHEYEGEDFLDLSPLVREELLLALPLRLLCEEDCKGLCSLCKKNLNKGPCDCAQKSKKGHPFENLKF